MEKKAKLVLFLARWSETVGARTFTNCCSDSNASLSLELQTISGKFDGAFVYNDFVYALGKWEEIVGAPVLVLRSTSRKKQCIRTIIAKCASPSYMQHFSDCDE